MRNSYEFIEIDVNVIFVRFKRLTLNLFSYPLGDSHIRIGNRTRLYAVSVLDCHRHYYFPVPTISRYFDIIGHKAAGFFHSIIKA